MFAFELEHFDWFSQFYSEWRQTWKITQFQDSFIRLGMQFR